MAGYPFIKDPAVLQDNYEQVKRRALAVERRLERTGDLECYNDQVKDFIAREAISPVSKEDLENYKDVVNYIDHHPVFNPEKLTTPVRLVVNSSIDNNNQGISVNDCWPKGPNSLKPLISCLMTFRSSKRVIVWDN